MTMYCSGKLAARPRPAGEPEPYRWAKGKRISDRSRYRFAGAHLPGIDVMVLNIDAITPHKSDKKKSPRA